MKKSLCLVILSSSIICQCLAGTALPAFAASQRMARSTTRVEQVIPIHQWERGSWYPGRAWRQHISHGAFPFPEINQFHVGNSNYNNAIHSVGHGIGNTGNSGHNRGHNEDNDASDGNQIITPSHLRGFRRVNQYYYGNSNYNNPIYHQGYDQANNGNSGTNGGLNQDNSSNGGNQIIG